MRATYGISVKGLMVAMGMALAVTACSSTNPAAPSALPAVAAASFDLAGQVVGAGGAGLAGVEITLSKGDDLERRVVTDEEGKFKITGLEGGDCRRLPG